MTIKMNKEQVLKDLNTLRGMFYHVNKYYTLSDKDLGEDTFNEIFEDLKEYLTDKLE